MTSTHVLVSILTAALLLTGCETIRDYFGGGSGDPAPTPTPEQPATPPPAPPAAGDAVAYTALRWNRGGYDGARAVRDAAVTITAVSVSGNTLRYSGTGLTVWPVSSQGGNINAVCSIFFDADRDGIYERGGKFDWARSNAADRPMGHLTAYKNWDGYPAPGTPFAFLLTTERGDKRSNVAAGVWR